MARARLVSASVAFLMLVLGSCGSRPEAPAPAAGLEHVSVSYSPFLTFGPLIIAKEEGYFTEQGLDVEFVKLTRSTLGTASLAQGELDVLCGAINAGLLNAIVRGADIRIVACKGYVDPEGCPQNVVFVRRDLMESGALDDPERVRGLRVSTKKDNLPSYFTALTLARLGLTLDDVELQFASTVARVEAIGSGDLDILHIGEPWVTRIKRKGTAAVWATDVEVVPGFQHAVLSFGPSLLHERPGVGERFLAGYLKGVRQFKQGKTERNLDIVQKYTELERDLLTEACWCGFHADGTIAVDSALELQTWLHEQGQLDRPLAAEEFWDPTFVRRANDIIK